MRGRELRRAGERDGVKSFPDSWSLLASPKALPAIALFSLFERLPKMMTSTQIVTPVKDLLNESFHENRPSFQSLKLEHGSFSIASNRSIHKLLKKQNTTSKNSFVSSISTDLGFISEDDCGDEGGHSQSQESLAEENHILNDQQQQPGIILEADSESDASPEVKKFEDLFTLGEEVGVA